MIKGGGRGTELLSLIKPMREMRQTIRNLEAGFRNICIFCHNFNLYLAGRSFICFYGCNPPLLCQSSVIAAELYAC